jgi:hypothetical protein
MDQNDQIQDMIREFGLTEKQALFCAGVLGGKKPLDVVLDVYDYTSMPNAYNQVASLMRNKKIDTALKNMGYNLKDQQEKIAFSVVKAFHDIAFHEDTKVTDKLSALKELAKYNPILRSIQELDISGAEEADLRNKAMAFMGTGKPNIEKALEDEMRSTDGNVECKCGGQYNVVGVCEKCGEARDE